MNFFRRRAVVFSVLVCFMICLMVLQKRVEAGVVTPFVTRGATTVAAEVLGAAGVGVAVESLGAILMLAVGAVWVSSWVLGPSADLSAGIALPAKDPLKVHMDPNAVQQNRNPAEFANAAGGNGAGHLVVAKTSYPAPTNLTSNYSSGIGGTTVQAMFAQMNYSAGQTYYNYNGTVQEWDISAISHDGITCTVNCVPLPEAPNGYTAQFVGPLLDSGGHATNDYWFAVYRVRPDLNAASFITGCAVGFTLTSGNCVLNTGAHPLKTADWPCEVFWNSDGTFTMDLYNPTCVGLVNITYGDTRVNVTSGDYTAQIIQPANAPGTVAITDPATASQTVFTTSVPSAGQGQQISSVTETGSSPPGTIPINPNQPPPGTNLNPVQCGLSPLPACSVTVGNTVNVNGTVGISGTPAVTISGTPTVRLADGQAAPQCGGAGMAKCAVTVDDAGFAGADTTTAVGHATSSLDGTTITIGGGGGGGGGTDITEYLSTHAIDGTGWGLFNMPEMTSCSTMSTSGFTGALSVWNDFSFNICDLPAVEFVHQLMDILYAMLGGFYIWRSSMLGLQLD
jgi:hypothetical protein